MAATAEARRLTEAHRQAQARLGSDTVRQMLAAFPLLDGTNLDGTFDRWLRVVVPGLRSQRSTSATLAANYLLTFRALELGVSAARMAPVIADVLPVGAVTTSLVVTGPASIKSSISRGVALPAAMETAQVATSRAAMRHVMDGGRQTIMETVRSDRQAKGWARATSGKACSFCAMIASRGPVFSEDTAHFEAHDGCSCSAEPVYRDDAAWPAGSAKYQAGWDQAKALARDEDIRPDVAFRRLVEGRA